MIPLRKYKCVKEVKNTYANFTYRVGETHQGKPHVNGRKNGFIIYDNLGFNNRDCSYVFYATKDVSQYFIEN